MKSTISKTKRVKVTRIAFLVFSVFLSLMVQRAAWCAENRLAIGDNATIQALDIPVQPPIDLNYKSKSEIMDLRKRYVDLNKGLLSMPYEPQESVFGGIENGKPWWGLKGQAVWGPGQHAAEGAAEESRFLVNPFLLAGANPAVVEIYDENKMTPDDLNRNDMPLNWQPTFIRWWPANSLMQVEYPVSKFNADLYAWRMRLKSDKILPAFGVVAYNALDFNLNYIYVDTARSLNIENINKPAAEAVKILHYIHCGGTCEIPGGCNNMSPEMKQIDKIKYTALPARCWVSLWKNKPANINAKPDMVVYIDLK